MNHYRGGGCAAGAAAVLLAGAARAQETEKQLKPGEYDVYNDVVKAINTNQFPNAITSLEAWSQKFPDSEFRNERAAFYVQAYAGANQPAKSVDAAGPLLSGDVNGLFPGKAAQATVIRLLYNTAWAISNVRNPTAEELVTGEKAARQLMAYDRQLPDLTPEQWASARADMKEKAASALFYIEMSPGLQAMAKQPPDCATAESAYSKALGDYPDKSALSYELGRALSCLAKEQPAKLPLAIYEFERAAVVDPTLGNSGNDLKKVPTLADNAYIRFHGSDQGLAELKEKVKQSALPPPGFSLQSATEIAEEKRAEFEKSNPQLALWLKIKGALSDTNGDQYFENDLKERAVPQLRGTLVEAKPSCRPKELLVSVPLPDAQQPLRAEIRLKFAKPLTGKPEPNTEFHSEG